MKNFKMPEFYMKLARKIIFPDFGGEGSNCPLFPRLLYTPMQQLAATSMTARGRSLARRYSAVELLSTRTRHEELMPAGSLLYAHVVRLAVGSRLQKHARSFAAPVFCERTNTQSGLCRCPTGRITDVTEAY